MNANTAPSFVPHVALGVTSTILAALDGAAWAATPAQRAHVLASMGAAYDHTVAAVWPFVTAAAFGLAFVGAMLAGAMLATRAWDALAPRVARAVGRSAFRVARAAYRIAR